MDIFISRIDDRFDKIEDMLNILLDKRLSRDAKPYYDNVDLMEITGLSYRTLQDYRLAKQLNTMNITGRNRYTEKEVHRFITEVLPYGRSWKKHKHANE